MTTIGRTMETLSPRKLAILESLAQLLEQSRSERITTAALAVKCGVSEAALYRHFPSKARMYEALIDFAEESIFSRINRILEEERSTLERCAKVLYLVLGFAEKNPGITRILLGDALVGEHDRLLERTEHLFARLETQLRQILREAHIRLDLANSVPAESFANLLLVWLEGRMHQYVRSHFKQSPLAQWEEQWSQLSSILSKPDQFPAG